MDKTTSKKLLNEILELKKRVEELEKRPQYIPYPAYPFQPNAPVNPYAPSYPFWPTPPVIC
jgi:hypothetical protein